MSVTWAPSRSSPEAETCKEPHRYGWSEPLPSLGSGAGTCTRNKGQSKVQSCSYAQVWSKKIKMLAGCFFLPQETSFCTTDLQTDPVLWIGLLAFRRGEHCRNGGGEKENGKRVNQWEHTRTAGRGHSTVKRQQREQMIPPPGSEDKEVKHTHRHAQCVHALYLSWHFPHEEPFAHDTLCQELSITSFCWSLQPEAEELNIGSMNTSVQISQNELTCYSGELCC